MPDTGRPPTVVRIAAPGDQRPPPALRVAESVLGGVAFVLLGFVLPVASVPAGALVILRRRREAGQQPTVPGSQGTSQVSGGGPVRAAVIPSPRRGEADDRRGPPRDVSLTRDGCLRVTGGDEISGR